MSEYKGFVDWKGHDMSIAGNSFKANMKAFLRKLGLAPKDPMEDFMKAVAAGIGQPDILIVSPKTLQDLNNLKP